MLRDPHAVTRAMSRLMKELNILEATVHDIRARLLNHVDGARSVTDAVYNQHEFWAEKRAAREL